MRLVDFFGKVPHLAAGMALVEEYRKLLSDMRVHPERLMRMTAYEEIRLLLHVLPVDERLSQASLLAQGLKDAHGDVRIVVITFLAESYVRLPSEGRVEYARKIIDCLLDRDEDVQRITFEAILRIKREIDAGTIDAVEAHQIIEYAGKFVDLYWAELPETVRQIIRKITAGTERAPDKPGSEFH